MPQIPVEITAAILGVLLPGVGVMVWRTIVYFHNKELCFKLLQQQVAQLSQAETGSHNTHSDLYKKVDDLEKNVHLIMGHLGIEPVS